MDLFKMEQSKVEQSKVEQINQYVAQFTPAEKIAYQIAIRQLETSFCIEKSIGFIKYQAKINIEHETCNPKK